MLRHIPILIDLARAYLEKAGAVGLLIVFGVLALNLLVTYLGAKIGLISSWRRDYDKPVLLLILMITVYFILLTGSQGYSRFRLPAIPFYLAFTGIGYSYLYEKIFLSKEKKKHRLK